MNFFKNKKTQETIDLDSFLPVYSPIEEGMMELALVAYRKGDLEIGIATLEEDWELIERDKD